jgi:secreted PhoX family phosphatase
MLWRRSARAAGSFGALIPDPDGIFDLPAGFSYRVIDRRGDAMSDGYRTPGRPDGMACFAGPGGTLILLRNHELSPTDGLIGPYNLGQNAPAQAYDPGQLGGVTRVVVNGATLDKVSSNLVLVGTYRNCAGGVSPWGWITCEEAPESLADHGFAFICPPDATGVATPQKVPAYGRFEHEAATVDPVSMIAYLTEDKGDSAFYRFVPTNPAQPFTGTLQALAIVGHDGFDTSTGNHAGDHWAIRWVDVANPTPSGAQTSVRAQAHTAGAAIIKRGEGLWLQGDAVWFVSTSGGPVAGGQIFRLDVDGDGGTLTLVAQSEDRDVLDMPDNITVAPWGDVFICEDSPGDNYLRVLDADGVISDFGRNAVSDSELTGACFSPDGTTLFVNIQNDGYTLAISGPFPTTPEPEPVDAGVPAIDAAVPDPDVDAAVPGTDGGEPPGSDAGVDPNPNDGDDGDGAGCGCEASSDAGLGAIPIAAATIAILRARA